MTAFSVMLGNALAVMRHAFDKVQVLEGTVSYGYRGFTSPDASTGRERMNFKRLNAFGVSATVALSLAAIPALHAYAQTADTGASAGASAGAMTKQQSKEQKKAEKKARREKKNAELSKLEKNGYNPAGNQTDYPQNLQKAQQKAAGQSPGNAPASAP